MFLEAELLPRTISFQRTGGPSFSTFVVGVESGNEQRNRNWSKARAKYTASIVTPPARDSDRATFVEDLLTNFFLIGGKTDPFRFFDHLDYFASGQALAVIDATHFQLQKTYSRFGRTYVRTITKPIMAAALDYLGNALTDTVVLKDGGGSVVAGTVDHATGIVTSANSPVTASFQYHIPVRLDTDDFNPQVDPSAVGDGRPKITWNSLSLIEVRPPNY